MPDLIRNRVTERDIRDWLQENGYEGGSAKLESVELHAIKRPGWKQLFRFSGKVRRHATGLDESPAKVPIWGVALDDERQPIGRQMEVMLFDTEDEQRVRLEELSANMLTSSRSGDGPSLWVMIMLAVLAAFVLFLISIVKSFYE